MYTISNINQLIIDIMLATDFPGVSDKLVVTGTAACVVQGLIKTTEGISLDTDTDTFTRLASKLTRSGPAILKTVYPFKNKQRAALALVFKTVNVNIFLNSHPEEDIDSFGPLNALNLKAIVAQGYEIDPEEGTEFSRLADEFLNAKNKTLDKEDYSMVIDKILTDFAYYNTITGDVDCLRFTQKSIPLLKQILVKNLIG